MSIDTVNQAAAQMGGEWVKLRYKDQHPPVEGVIVAFEERAKTWEGQTVTNKHGEPRTEWVFTLRNEADPRSDDKGIMKIALNESAQRAVKIAVKEADCQMVLGGTLKIGVQLDPETDTSQADYRARYTAPADVVPINEDDF